MSPVSRTPLSIKTLDGADDAPSIMKGIPGSTHCILEPAMGETAATNKWLKRFLATATILLWIITLSLVASMVTGLIFTGIAT
ncbi:hypothetical protein MMC10_006210, partial [Thelotrema lepadinum]|nr:hypothetical protein [Thelotrema lepadinum]